MNSNLLKTLLVVSLVSLVACNGGSSTPNTPTPEPAAVKKTINVDNLNESFSTYLLYRYRLSTELLAIKEFSKIPVNPDDGIGKCQKQGTLQRNLPSTYVRLVYNSCQTDSGTVVSGTTEVHPLVGTAKTTWLSFTDLNYQLSDDSEYQKLTGSYVENNSFPRSIDFTLNYNSGTRTALYKVDPVKLNIVDIRTTAISGNQHFTLRDLDEAGKAITPILSADDSSNLSISFESNGAASLSLRNDAGGKIISTKTYSKSEVDDMLVGIRRAKK